MYKFCVTTIVTSSDMNIQFAAIFAFRTNKFTCSSFFPPCLVNRIMIVYILCSVFVLFMFMNFGLIMALRLRCVSLVINRLRIHPLKVVFHGFHKLLYQFYE